MDEDLPPGVYNDVADTPCTSYCVEPNWLRVTSPGLGYAYVWSAPAQVQRYTLRALRKVMPTLVSRWNLYALARDEMAFRGYLDGK